MEKVKDELSIQDWGIRFVDPSTVFLNVFDIVCSQSTLEDVFIGVTREEERKSLSVKIE